MPIDLAPMPMRLRVAALHGEAAAAATLHAHADAAGAEMPQVRVEHHSVVLPWNAAVADALLAGRVDLVLVVTAPAVEVPATFLTEAVDVIASDPTVAAVGSPLLGGEPERHPFAPCGGLLLLRRDAVQLVGGLGAAPPDALTHLDLCSRLWLAGFRVGVAGPPRRQPVGSWPPGVLRPRLLEVLATMLEDEDLTDPAWRSPEAVAAVHAVSRRRADMASLRRRGTGELSPLLLAWSRAFVAAGGEEEIAEVVAGSGAPTRAGAARRILVVTMDVLAPRMAGPAIRATAIALGLSEEHDVRLVTTARCEMDDGELPFTVNGASDSALRELVDWCDVIVLQGWVLSGRPWISAAPRVVVVDAYDPMHLEQLEQGRDRGGTTGRVDAVRGATAVLNDQLRRADLVLCASDKQRDFWLGALGALGRVNPVTYDDDPSMYGLITVVPFGVPDEPFPDGPGALKGVVDGIGLEDQVLLWGGGIYNWFDPLTLVHAVHRLRERVPRVRLFFMGSVHPNPGVPAMQMAAAARELSDRLELTGRHVFFNDGWVPFDDRAGYLHDADVGVSTHLDHVETAFSFRTRILDYLWAGLPVVSTEGDSFAVLLAERGAGRVVPPEDPAALEEALAAFLVDSEHAGRARVASRALADELRWSASLEPLAAFCRRARRAPDVACPTLTSDPTGAEIETGWRRDVVAARTYLRDGGLSTLAHRVAGRLRRRWDQIRRR